MYKTSRTGVERIMDLSYICKGVSENRVTDAFTSLSSGASTISVILALGLQLHSLLHLHKDHVNSNADAHPASSGYPTVSAKDADSASYAVASPSAGEWRDERTQKFACRDGRVIRGRGGS